MRGRSIEGAMHVKKDFGLPQAQLVKCKLRANQFRVICRTVVLDHLMQLDTTDELVRLMQVAQLSAILRLR